MRELKFRDKVKITKRNLDGDNRGKNGVQWDSIMDNDIGQILTIGRDSDSGCGWVTVVEHPYLLDKDWCDLIEEPNLVEEPNVGAWVRYDGGDKIYMRTKNY